MNEARYRAAEQAWWAHCGVQPSERVCTLAQPQARLRLLETGSGRPLLFLHGGPSAASVFAPLAARLQDFRCLLPDRPGCGLSPRLADDARALDTRMTGLLCALLDTLGLERADIVGSSFGGACALWLARRHPDRVGRIVLMGCPPFVTPARMPPFLRGLATPGLGALLCRLPAGRAATRSFLGVMGERAALNAGLIPAAFFDWWIALGRDTATMVNERALIRSGLSWRGMRPALVIPDAALPPRVCLYWGADEPFAEAARMRALFDRPQRRMHAGALGGHLPWLADPEGAARCTRAFLEAAE